MNATRPKGNNKHLDISERIEIEKGLANGESFREIARKVNKDPKKGLIENEIDLMHKAPRILAMELGMRFIGDYLNGDEYFKLKEGIYSIDKNAFFVVTDAYEVYGGE